MCVHLSVCLFICLSLCLYVCVCMRVCVQAFNLLQVALSSVPPGDMVIILSDFNAHVGSDFVSHRSVIGPHAFINAIRMG